MSYRKVTEVRWCSSKNSPPPPQKKRWSKPSLRALSIEQGTASGAIQLGTYEEPNYRPES